MADAKLDGWLGKVEEAVLSHQAGRLARWAERQRLSLRRAVEVEQAASANNSSITDGVIVGAAKGFLLSIHLFLKGKKHIFFGPCVPIAGVQDELKQRDAERQRMRQHTKEVKDECDQHFQRELRRMRRAQKAMAKEVLEHQSVRWKS